MLYVLIYKIIWYGIINNICIKLESVGEGGGGGWWLLIRFFIFYVCFVLLCFDFKFVNLFIYLYWWNNELNEV